MTRPLVPPSGVSRPGALPASEPLPDDYAKVFANTALARQVVRSELSTRPELVAQVDAFYLDGFAPDRNPASVSASQPPFWRLISACNSSAARSRPIRSRPSSR